MGRNGETKTEIEIGLGVKGFAKEDEGGRGPVIVTSTRRDGDYSGFHIFPFQSNPQLRPVRRDE